MIIWRSCCFWLCSLITRDKLTWKHIRLVGLLRPPSLRKLPHPHPPTPPPTITPSFPAPPPMQATPLPSCIRPFSVTILYFDGSQRKKERDKETERLGLLWLSDMGPSFFFFSIYLFFPSSLPSSSDFFQLSLLPFFNSPLLCFLLYFSLLLFRVPPDLLFSALTPSHNIFISLPLFLLQPLPQDQLLPPRCSYPCNHSTYLRFLWLPIASLLAAFRKLDKACRKRGARA